MGMTQIVKIKEENAIQDIIDTLPFYVLIVDERHHIVRVNQAVVNQTGL
jgi:PAS domain-containing protein